MWRHAEIHAVPDVARYWAATTPDAIALTSGSGTRTYRDLDRTASRIANALRRDGVDGRPVGYVGKNAVEFWEAWMGVTKAGSALMPMNWRFTVRELLAVVDDARPLVVLADAESTPILREVQALAAEPFTIVTFGDLSPAAQTSPEQTSPESGESSLDGWLGAADSSDPATPIGGDEVALISYTSGTSGRAKGVLITHRALMRWFVMASTEPTEEWSADDVLLMVMPNFHLAGSWLSFAAIYHGGTIAILPTFEPNGFFSAVREFAPTVMCLVPTAIQMLVDHPLATQTDFSSVKRVLYAGSAIRPDTIRKALDVLGCDLVQFYGATEVWIISMLRPAQHDPNDPDLIASAGQPYPFVEIRVVDDAGVTVPNGSVGEILIRTPAAFAGYLGQPEATAEVYVDGWYHSGDLGSRDDAGNLTLRDRKKDMIVTGGENVYSIEVENALAEHPGVAQVAVVGVPDDTWGERITAAVVRRPGSELDEAALVLHARDRIARYKVPKQIVFLDALPTTASGKVRKDLIRGDLALEATR